MEDHSQTTPRALALYFALAFAFTWAVLVPTLGRVPADVETLFIILAAFGPFIAAVVTIWTISGRSELRRWLRQVFRFRIPVILYVAGAIILPIGVGAAQFGLYRLLGGLPSFSTALPWWTYLPSLIATALLTGGNEEPGWRGYALPALLEQFHPTVAAAILGVIHAAWHLPLMQRYNTTFGWYAFNVVPLTVIFNWLYLRSRKSVIPVMLFHAGTNVIGDFFPTPSVVLGGVGTYIVLRGIVYWVLAMVLLIKTRGRLGYEPRDARDDMRDLAASHAEGPAGADLGDVSLDPATTRPARRG